MQHVKKLVFACENYRQPRRTLRPHHIIQPEQIDFQSLAIENSCADNT